MADARAPVAVNVEVVTKKASTQQRKETMPAAKEKVAVTIVPSRKEERVRKRTERMVMVKAISKVYRVLVDRNDTLDAFSAEDQAAHLAVTQREVSQVPMVKPVAMIWTAGRTRSVKEVVAAETEVDNVDLLAADGEYLELVETVVNVLLVEQTAKKLKVMQVKHQQK